jgi:crotonobetaine/carnitine-CoA ligase
MRTTKPGQTVEGILRATVQAAPDRLFLDFSGIRLSYGQTDREVDRLALGLQRLGINVGDRVAVMLDSGPDAVLTWLATNRIGAIHVPINTAYKGDYLRQQISDSGAETVVVEPDLFQRVRDVWDETPDLRHVLQHGACEEAGAGRIHVSALDHHRVDGPGLRRVEADPAGPAMLLYTSGTTGPAKGCRCSHNYVADQGVRLTEMVKRGPDELNWTPLPLFHVFGIATVVSSAVVGGAAAFTPRFSVSGFWPEVERTGASVVSLLGSMAAMLANAEDTESSRRCHGRIRALLAAPMGSQLRRTWRERFGVQYAGLNAYGQTEAGSMISCAVDEALPDGSTGRRNDTLDVRVFDADDREVPPGEVGEVVVRPLGAHAMFDGYWKQPPRSPDAWHHTGDLGRFDEQGNFYFVDRKKDYLRRRGENISSIQVETSLLRHPDVIEVAVHAVASEVTEDDVKATVVLAPGSMLTPEELIRWADALVPYFALPRYVEFRDGLPKNPVGRVLKYQLREEGVTPDTWDRDASGITVTRR